MKLDDDAIYTDENGRPFERPERPGSDATTEERIAYIRAMNAYRDAITDCANAAFDKQFQLSMKT